MIYTAGISIDGNIKKILFFNTEEARDKFVKMKRAHIKKIGKKKCEVHAVKNPPAMLMIVPKKEYKMKGKYLLDLVELKPFKSVDEFMEEMEEYKEEKSLHKEMGGNAYMYY